MSDTEDSNHGFVAAVLPWMAAIGALSLYVLTLNQWINLRSLILVSKVAGWDSTPAVQFPLFFSLTYPVRWLPELWRPVALNLFSAVCAAATLGLLARSVALLPHDRTHEQRQRERSEFSLLTIGTAWLPPVFAVLVCGFQMTMWENATAATGECLDLLLFSYVIRCLLEHRIDHQDRWLVKLAFVYGLGVTNNFAMIAFFPLFLVALIWIKGFSLFRFKTISRMLLWGLAGLLLYLLLPLAWKAGDSSSPFTFWQFLKANLAAQKQVLFGVPALRGRALLLSLTSVLPIVVMGIRWPSSFGDTSRHGALLTNLMFRLIHFVFLVACLFVSFDPKFSPRALGLGFAFLPFYYLGALSIGYFSGYLLLVFGEASGKIRHRPSGSDKAVGTLVQFIVWLLFLGTPVALMSRNFPGIRASDGSILKQFLALSVERLPAQNAILLCDDATQILMLKALFSTGPGRTHILVNTRSLEDPRYHQLLLKTHPGKWPQINSDLASGLGVDSEQIQKFIAELVRSNQAFYLHPSFGYYFENIYLRPDGMNYQLRLYETNEIAPPPLAASELKNNNDFWEKSGRLLDRVEKTVHLGLPDSQYAANFFSRALNYWGVQLQRRTNLVEAGKLFQRAVDINTNNICALANLDFNKSLQTKRPTSPGTAKTIEDRFGKFRTWDAVLAQNGPFDEPDYCFRLGQVFIQQSLFRQAADQFRRAIALNPSNFAARISLGNSYLFGHLPAQAEEVAAAIRADYAGSPLALTNQIQLIALDASILFARTNYAAAETMLLEAQAKYPSEPSILESLTEMYRVWRKFDKAIEKIDEQLKLSPNDPGILLLKTSMLLEESRFDEASKELDQLLKAVPGNVEGLLYRVFIAIQQKKPTDALVHVQTLLSIDPKNYQGMIYEGIAYLEIKEYDKAISSLSRALKGNPNDSTILRNRAIVYLQSGRLDDAQADYETLRRLYPKIPAVYYGLAEIASKRNRTAEAIDNFELYLKYSPQGPAAEQIDEIKQVKTRLQELKAGRK